MKKMILFTAGLMLSSQLLFASSEEIKGVKFDDLLKDLKIEVLETTSKKTPTIVFINKCGEIVGELYGDKNELVEKFQSTIQKGHLISSSSSMEVYLIK